MNTSLQLQTDRTTALHPQYLVFSHQPLFFILLVILTTRFAFIQREDLQPILKLTELWLQITSVQLNTHTNTNRGRNFKKIVLLPICSAFTCLSTSWYGLSGKWCSVLKRFIITETSSGTRIRLGPNYIQYKQVYGTDASHRYVCQVPGPIRVQCVCSLLFGSGVIISGSFQNGSDCFHGLFMREGTRRSIRWIGMVAAVMHTLYQSDVIKRELSLKVNALIWPSHMVLSSGKWLKE